MAVTVGKRCSAMSLKMKVDGGDGNAAAPLHPHFFHFPYELPHVFCMCIAFFARFVWFARLPASFDC